MKKDTQLTNEIKKLQYQLSYSEHISIDRELSDYLRTLCEKTGLPMRKTTSMQNVNLINTQNHLQELYYVQPLLMAYQHQVNLLQSQLKQIRDDSQSLLTFGQQIVNQNNFLRKELQAKNQYIQKSQEIGLNANFLKLDNQNLMEKNTLLKEKNQFLTQKVRELEEKNEREKINVSRPNLDFSQTVKELKSERERFKETELQLIQLENNLEIVTNQLNNQKSLLSQQERKNFQLQNEIIKLKNDLKISKQQSESHQVTRDATIDNLQLQLQSLKSQLLTAQRRENDLFTKSMALESQNQDKNSKLHNMTLQNTQLQTNNNNILQMLQNYETKSTSQAKKIKQLEAEIKDYNQSVLNMRKDSEMLDWKLTEKEKELERKEGEWKKEKERNSRVWEERFEAMKKALAQEKESLHDEIQQLRNDK